jgi:arginase
MDAPTIQPKFLKKGNELGIVAVGFSGGQVSGHYNLHIG